jgi:hypothetical protein
LKSMTALFIARDNLIEVNFGVHDRCSSGTPS